MTESIKFFWNGIRVNGCKSLIKCYYSIDNNHDGRPEVHISARGYSDSLPGDVFAVENGTDSMTDYFETDGTRIGPDHPLYKYARRAALESEIHYAQSGIKYAEKRAAAGGYMADYYKKDAAERRERLEAQRAELETLPKGQPTAADLEAVREMNLAAETARKAREHAEELEHREEQLRKRHEDRAYIEDVMAAHPLNSGKPVLTVRWSEHPAFSSWEEGALKMSIPAAEIILKHFDDERHAENVRTDGGGYFKTKFLIEYTNAAGEASSYEGRYDLGDGDGGLIAHIRAFGESYMNFKKELTPEEEQEKAAILEFAEMLDLVVYADKVRAEVAEEERGDSYTTATPERLEKLKELFDRHYSAMYDGREDMSDGAERFDRFSDLERGDPEFRKLVQAFGTYRGDVVSSDREAAAFMAALDELNGIGGPAQEAHQNGGAVVSVSLAPWVEQALAEKKKQEDERNRQETQDLMDAVEMMPDELLEAAVFQADPNELKGLEVGRFFLHFLYLRDEKKALDVFRRWKAGEGQEAGTA